MRGARFPGWSVLAAATLLATSVVAPLAGQMDPDHTWDADQYQHMAAGAALDVVFRGPWIAKEWRTVPGRLVLVTAVGAAYEGLQYYEARVNGTLGQEGYGFSLLDLAADVAGAVAMEGVVWLIRRIGS